MKYIIKCTNCENLSFSSDKETNIFGDNQFYTDDTYLSREYIFVRCPHCYETLNIEQTQVHKIKPTPAINKRKIGDRPTLSNARCINLNLMEYYKLLNETTLSQEEEINIRSHILNLENDKRRDNSSSEYLIPYNENELKNLSLLEKKIDEDILLKVEINRYLGNFDQGLKLLSSYQEKGFYSKDYIILQYKLLKEKAIYLKAYRYSEDTLKVLKTIRR